ncbi:MAG: fibronectin [Candidatus Marinimicrobia bacterium]|nr:fibronectin [Candidatus Neomarinimicrobiota bacterium]
MIDFIKNNFSLLILTIIVFILPANSIMGQGISENETRHIRIGDLQSHFSAYGSERGWNNSYYEGLKWPALYPYTDNAVIKRAWVAMQDFTDAEGVYWDHWANYFYKGYVNLSLYPMELKQSAKFPAPTVYVDGEDITAPYRGDVDTIDASQIPDRIVNNLVNMSCGLTMTRRVKAFSQQFHDDYLIKEFIFTNTGNVDYDPEVELTDSLKGLRIGWGTRYSVSREGSMHSDYSQSYGKHSWVTRRGENYKQHYQEVKNFTENTPLDQLEWIRCAFSWLGQSEDVSYDMVGAPYINSNGRLTAPQFAGFAVLHVDKNAENKEDDPEQPVFLGWHAGDTYPSIGNLRQSDKEGMSQVYSMLSGNPHGGESNGGSTRMFEENTESITDQVDPYKVHGDGGGTNAMVTYGPFDLAHGESIKIVEVEGVQGLNRTLCEKIGDNWLKENSPYQLPPDGAFPNEINYGSTTGDKDIYKNAWVYTGMDSILQTFSRALRNYNMNYEIPQPPKPPTVFNIESGGDKIKLSWAVSPSKNESNFAGYRIYRAVGKPDTTYERIADLPKGTTYFEDKSAVRGFSYYYYISAYSDGSKNNEGIANPTGELESNKFYTLTNKPAYLRRKAGKDLDNIMIVPNPYNIRAKDLQYTGEPDKIMFLNIPAYCKIRIFTERGDLIKTINHNDGSGDEPWNSITSSRQTVVSGVYLVHFEVTRDYADPETNELLYNKGDSITKKLVIVR